MFELSDLDFDWSDPMTTDREAIVIEGRECWFWHFGDDPETTIWTMLKSHFLGTDGKWHAALVECGNADMLAKFSTHDKAHAFARQVAARTAEAGKPCERFLIHDKYFYFCTLPQGHDGDHKFHDNPSPPPTTQPSGEEVKRAGETDGYDRIRELLTAINMILLENVGKPITQEIRESVSLRIMRAKLCLTPDPAEVTRQHIARGGR